MVDLSMAIYVSHFTRWYMFHQWDHCHSTSQYQPASGRPTSSTHARSAPENGRLKLQRPHRLAKVHSVDELGQITASMCSLPAGTGHTACFWVPEIIKPSFQHSWLVVSTPLKNISQLGWWFPVYWKIKKMFQTTNQIGFEKDHQF